MNEPISKDMKNDDHNENNQDIPIQMEADKNEVGA